ncbi:heavy metal sensor histidine kinase [Paludisphaera rhizosphaerae]|uniref:heavy metal sensor histidine kinase n=1 Tax=Paludisphaera rhizosphaerae TaxID=2711216 RepID=UPI0013E9BFEF|nr:heavy metal sensor histidine kinase [Paludisphaera rhizosphaerae]
MPRASLRVRLTAWNAALVMATIAGLGLALYMLLAQALLRRIDGMLDFEFQEAAERLVHGKPTEILEGSPAAFHEVYLLRILDQGGRIEVESPGLAGQTLPPPQLGAAEGALNHSDARIDHIGESRVVTGSTHGRIVQIATPLRSYERDLIALRGVLWTILPAGLVLSTLGGYWLAGRALAPVGRMTAAAQRISAANLGERIEVAHEGDELGRLATTLNDMLDRIDQAFVAARRFTADAAHELKTPLASLRAEAEVALILPRSPEDYREALRSVVEEAERLSRLAERLLLLSGDDAGVELPRRSFRLDEIVREAVDKASQTAADLGVSLRMEELPEAIVAGDSDLLRQVFDNLIENALKYTPAGGAVTIRGHNDDSRAVFEVSDTGVGIPADSLPRVFDRFYRVDASRSRRTGGTGLGLSIVRAVVERHGGSVETESTPGEGSTFQVVLPVATTVAAASVRKN